MWARSSTDGSGSRLAFRQIFWKETGRSGLGTPPRQALAPRWDTQGAQGHVPPRRGLDTSSTVT